MLYNKHMALSLKVHSFWKFCGHYAFMLKYWQL